MFLLHLLRSSLLGNKENNVEQWFIVVLLVLYTYVLLHMGMHGALSPH